MLYILCFWVIDAAFASCYIATMVYGSYDAPEVLVLRRFRDDKLAPYLLGRLCIKLYYSFSPGFVYVFKNNKSVNKFIKLMLDKLVRKLREKAVLRTQQQPILTINNQ
jgi:hypothetical protein